MGDFNFFERCKSENFSTALLAFSMRRSPEFCDKIVRKLAPCEWGDIAHLEIEQIEPQHTIEVAGSSMKRPDLVIIGKADSKEFIVALEVKIGQDFGEGQLKNYRTWLLEQRKPLTALATLTCRQYNWRDGDAAKPNAALRWIDLPPLIAKMESHSGSDFERSYWKHFRIYVEGIMRSFEGFTSGVFDVHGLMQEIDLFLRRLFEELGVKGGGRWEAAFSGYDVPELAAKVGFYWWHGDFWDEQHPNELCIKKIGEKEPIFLDSLKEIITETNDPATRDDYIKGLARQIRETCMVKTEAEVLASDR
jgi:hypothetical protein